MLDLGAHVGSFSLAAAAAGYEVAAVEASPRNAALLAESIRRNGFDRLRLVHAGVSDRPGTLRFTACGPYGHVVEPGSPWPNVEVRAFTVDDLLAELGWPRVDFIKMDIEGSEVAAVRGMARLLSRPDAPPIVYESNGHTLAFFDRTPTDLKRALEQFGYRNYLVDDGRLAPVRAADVQPTTVVDYLAVRRRPARLREWRTHPAPDRATLSARAMASAASANEAERPYIARTLARAPHWLRSRPEMVDAAEQLRRDPKPEVRAVAGAIEATVSGWSRFWAR